MGSYFIKIEDGPAVRRRVLESSKASLHVLRGYQQLLVIRGQKLSLMNDLRRDLRELTMLLNRAEALMPQHTPAELDEFAPKPKALPVKAEEKPEGKWVKKGNRKVFVAAPKRQVVTEVPLQAPSLDVAPEPEKPRPKMTELERLEAALAQVESKLDKI